VLQRIESGTSGPADAETVRKFIAAQTVQALTRWPLPNIVLRAVTERGYREGWQSEEFMARQIAKAYEELAELAQLFKLPQELWEAATSAGTWARTVFDTPQAWYGTRSATTLPTLRGELADVLIPLLCVAAELNLDIAAAVVEKVQSDIARGVR